MVRVNIYYTDGANKQDAWGTADRELAG